MLKFLTWLNSYLLVNLVLLFLMNETIEMEDEEDKEDEEDEENRVPGCETRIELNYNN